MSAEREETLGAGDGQGAPEVPAGDTDNADGTEGTDDTDGAGGEARLDALEAQLAEAQARLSETEARLQRTQADFANYRRRMMAEQQRWGDRAVARLAADLLPVVDNLERALAALDSARDSGLEAIGEGIRLTLRQFLDILAGHGIQPIAAVGLPFDPHVHEAVGHVETDAVPDDHVAAELQRGYTFKDEVLRPALVQVARRPAQADADSADSAPPSDVTDEEDEEDTDHGQGRGH